MTAMHRSFSGAQPTGGMTIGNYIGAIQQWQQLQIKNDCLFCVVDLHALTAGLDPKVIYNNTLQTFALFLACNLDPEKSTVFIQSTVAEHAELTWLLQSIAGIGELQRMTQFKDKSQRYAKNINLGLFTYPTLMAADILLYQTNSVPVGDDQKQHLELTRDLAIRFNKKYGETFTIPKPHILEQGARIMSLQDPSKKMSKSDLNQQSYISLLDSKEMIIKKIKRSVTDSQAVIAADANRPGINNLVTIYAALANLSPAAIEAQYINQGYGQFKQDLAELIISHLEPIQSKYELLLQDKNHLMELINQGKEKATVIANQTLFTAKQNIGLI